MASPFIYTLDNKRYHTWNYYLKNRYGSKVYKVPLSLGTTCPHRNEKKGTGGCSFCGNGGGGTPFILGNLKDQFLEAQIPLEKKWPNSLAIAYFQNYTNTFLPAAELDSALEESLSLPKVVGICVATRPDCLPPDIMNVLTQYSKKTDLMVELGLQTIHQKTSNRIGRGHNYEDFLDGYRLLQDAGIPVCIHIINGLPDETPEMMLDTVREISRLRPHSIKFHMLHILEGTRLAGEYKDFPFSLLTKEEYVSVLSSQLELLPPETVVQRVTGDPPKDSLVAPLWTTNKLWVRNAVDKEMAARNSYQGKYYK